MKKKEQKKQSQRPKSKRAKPMMPKKASEKKWKPFSIFGAESAPDTVQKSIPYKAMYRDGLCKVTANYYTLTLAYEDINYQLAQNEDKVAIFENYCDLTIL